MQKTWKIINFLIIIIAKNFWAYRNYIIVASNQPSCTFVTLMI